MKISWIKLELDLFDNKKIKKIRRMPDGDKLLLVWIHLLLEAGKCNAGGMIFISEKVPLDIDDIAKDLNFEISVVQLAIKTLLRLDMIMMDEKQFIYISDWENHQNIEGMEKTKLLRKERNNRYYEKKKLELLTIKTTIKTRKDAIDKTREDKTRINNTMSSIPYKKIIEDLNNTCNSDYQYSSKSTKDKIQARINEGFIFNDFKKVHKIKAEQWLNDNGMNKYLRPKTLYSNKFESYLQEYKRKYKDESVSTGGMSEREKKYFEEQRSK